MNSQSTLSPSAFARIKVCGLTRRTDVEFATQLGAWALGFILVPTSARAVSLSTISSLLDPLANSPATAAGSASKLNGPLRVAVTVNATLAEATRILESGYFHGIQCHGDENAEHCAHIKARFPGAFVMKALRLAHESDLMAISAFSGCDAVLLDSYHPHLAGGTGVLNRMDWIGRAIKEKRHPHIIVSGGLKPDNVEEAARSVLEHSAGPHPFAWDVSSGLESEAGIKDHHRMTLFFQNLKNSLERSQKAPQ